jgi:hypothetical protein
VVTGSAVRDRQPEPGQAGQGELVAQAVFQRELAGDEALAGVADHQLGPDSRQRVIGAEELGRDEAELAGIGPVLGS